MKINHYWMWFDDSKLSVKDKIAGGMAAYRQKFGVLPTTCLLNVAYANEQVDGVVLELADNVRPNNFWFGVDEKTT